MFGTRAFTKVWLSLTEKHTMPPKRPRTDADRQADRTRQADSRNAISTEKGQGRKRPRKDSAGARRSPLVAPYSLQLHAVGELVYRARLFAVKLYNHRCPPSLNLKLPTRPCRHHRFFVPAYGSLSLTKEERLRVTGCGLMAMLVLRLTHGINCPAKTRLMRVEGVVQHVAAVRAAAANEALFQQAQQLYAVGKYAATVAKYKEAIANGHAASHAELAWLLLSGREGVRVNQQKAFELAEKGASMDCMHSRGVLAFIYYKGLRGSDKVYKGHHKHSASKFKIKSNVTRAVHLASASLAAGSKYGQFVFGLLCKNGNKGWLPKVAKDVIRAVALMRMAAAQGLDAALLKLAKFYHDGTGGIAKDDQEYSRWLLLSANQGYAPACNEAGEHFERMALDFYEKGAACGDATAKYSVRMFERMYCGPPLDDSDSDSDSDSDGDDSDNYDDDGPKRRTPPQKTRSSRKGTKYIRCGVSRPTSPPLYVIKREDGD
jgi:TPR repeat protein